MRNEEHEIQSQIVQILIWNHIRHFSVPNGIFFNSSSKAKSFAYIHKLKMEGFFAGCSDLVILLPKRAVFCEIKTLKGKQSENQKIFEEIVKNLGFEYYIWRSVEDCEKFIKEIKSKKL